MAKGKKISEQPIVESLQGDELIPFAKDGANGAVTPDTIKEFTNEGLDDTYATIERVNDQLDGFAPKSWLASTDQEVSRINDALISGLNDKVDKIDGKGLSTNDFTDEDKAKLDRLELVLLTDDEIEDGLHQIAESEDYRAELKERGYVVYHDVKYKVKDCGVDSNSYPWIITEGAVITDNAEGTLNDHTQENVVRSVYIWFDTILHYQPYNTPLSDELFTSEDRTKLDGIEAGAQVNPTKVSELQNDAKYQTETQVENRVAVLSQVWDAQLEGAFNNLDNKKVDKVTGKQLSTEDFTTALKEKLQGLTNYDDATLTAELNALKSRLDTLVGSGDVTAVIDTFQEIEAFLQGITNTQTLTGLLQEMKSEIVQLCADTYVSKKGDEEIGGKKTFTSRVTISSNIDTKIVINNTDGEKYSIISLTEKFEEFGKIVIEGRDNSNKGISIDMPFRAKSIRIENGTSSQFLKADGSVDSTAYLPKSGGEVTGKTTFNTATFNDSIESHRSAQAAAAMRFSNSDGLLGYLGVGVSKQPFFSTGSDDYKLWHEGNDGSGSGLDADKLDGKEPADLNVGSADKLTTKQLTNEDLNEIKDDKLSIYYAPGANTCTNVPSGMNASKYFSLQCSKTSDGRYFQILVDAVGTIFKRAFTSANGWSSWQQLATTDGAVAKLTTKQLTNENLNDIKDINFSVYYGDGGNTCMNKPYEVNGFNLQVLRTHSTNRIQILTTVSGVIYTRYWNNTTWSAWVKMASVNDAVAKLTTKQLTNEDLNNIKDVNFSSYFAYDSNTCVNKPSAITGGFILQVCGKDANTTVQTITDFFNHCYRRFNNSGTWSAWKKMLTEDDLTKVVSVSEVPSTPASNTLYVIPE